MNKAEQRSSLLQKRVELTPEKVKQLSEVIQSRLIKSDYWPTKGRIGLYSSVKNEVLTHDIFRFALESGLHVYFPRVEQGIKFYEVNGPEDLQRGSWSIPEPKKYCSSLDTNHLDLLVVPGIAFTKSCQRIGYGKAFYDRYILEKNFESCKFIGLCYDFQMIDDDIDFEQTDQKMTAIVTEKNIYTA